jgi:hypothetical protein
MIDAMAEALRACRRNISNDLLTRDLLAALAARGYTLSRSEPGRPGREDEAYDAGRLAGFEEGLAATPPEPAREALAGVIHSIRHQASEPGHVSCVDIAAALAERGYTLSRSEPDGQRSPDWYAGYERALMDAAPSPENVGEHPYWCGGPQNGYPQPHMRCNCTPRPSPESPP